MEAVYACARTDQHLAVNNGASNTDGETIITWSLHAGHHTDSPRAMHSRVNLKKLVPGHS